MSATPTGAGTLSSTCGRSVVRRKALNQLFYVPMECSKRLRHWRRREVLDGPVLDTITPGRKVALQMRSMLVLTDPDDEIRFGEIGLSELHGQPRSITDVHTSLPETLSRERRQWPDVPSSTAHHVSATGVGLPRDLTLGRHGVEEQLSKTAPIVIARAEEEDSFLAHSRRQQHYTNSIRRLTGRAPHKGNSLNLLQLFAKDLLS